MGQSKHECTNCRVFFLNAGPGEVCLLCDGELTPMSGQQGDARDAEPERRDCIEDAAPKVAGQ